MTTRDDTPVLAVGLMSGTSMDGIDAALVRTDGGNRVDPLAGLSIPYDDGFRARLRAVLGRVDDLDGVADELTRRHAEAVARLLDRAGVVPGKVALAGFHGHNVHHDPGRRLTVQIGDGALLARLTGIDVVADFRSADVAAGGQGAPLAPIYHAARVREPWPTCVLNLGGVGNVTWIGAEADPAGPDPFAHMLAFDTGPANALVDDWVAATTGAAYDADGALAAAGTVDEAALGRLFDDPWLDLAPPKSLDRLDFRVAGLDGLSAADGAATLTAFTAACVGRAARHLPQVPTRWIATGGGRRNATMLAMLRTRLAAPVVTAEDEGLDGDFMEAQAFAYLAVRSARGLPLSGPGTTGVPAPQCGGRLFRAG